MTAANSGETGITQANQMLQQAIAALDQGHLPAAELLLTKITRLELRNAEAFAVFGDLRRIQQRPYQACGMYKKAIELNPNHYAALCNLAILQSDVSELGKNEELLRRAIVVAPDQPNAYVNLGYILQQSARHSEAISQYQAALELFPQSAMIYFNIGNAYFALERHDAAIKAWRTAIECDPAFGETYWNLAQVLLLTGNYADGWAALAKRSLSSALSPATPHFHHHPQWTGGEISGKRVLLWGEQGFGDEIQFARFATSIAERGAIVILAVHPKNQKILTNVVGVSQSVSRAADLPTFDLHCALMDIPLLLHTTLDSIPATPYICADEDLEQRWALRLPRRRRLRVGLVWSSGVFSHDPALYQVGMSKSIDLSLFAKLWSLNADFFSLQPGSKNSTAGTPIFDWGDEFSNFADTAALVSNMDLVISVDTAVAHLSGALGISTWVLLKKQADWRWGTEVKTPWYARARLFRQSKAGDWGDPFLEVTKALTELIANSSYR